MFNSIKTLHFIVQVGFVITEKDLYQFKVQADFFLAGVYSWMYVCTKGFRGRGEQGAPWPLQFFRNRRNFGSLSILWENVRLLLFVKLRVSNFIGKSLNLAAPTLQVPRCLWFVPKMHQIFVICI